MDPSLENTEDLLADATALVHRAEIKIPPGSDPIVFGFRENGALSIFFDTEVVYHFNSRHHLRRVFLHGERYKAERGQLVCVRRIPGLRNVQLQSIPIEPPQLEHIFSVLDERLHRWHTMLNQGDYRIVNQISPGDDVVQRLQDCIPQLKRHQIALLPQVDT